MTDDDDAADDAPRPRADRLREMFRRAAEIAEISAEDKELIAKRLAAGDEQGAQCVAEQAVKRAIISEVEAMLDAGGPS